MTEARYSVVTAGLSPASDEQDLRRANRELRAELEALEPVISAAVLTATAFRLRDHDALIGALRLLVRAVRRLEERTACA